MKISTHLRNLQDIHREKGLARAVRFDVYKTLSRWVFPLLYPKTNSWDELCKNRRSLWKGLLAFYTPSELYTTITGSVRKGIAIDTDGQQLREMAEDYSFSLDEVEESIRIGAQSYYKNQISELRDSFESGSIGISHEYTERKLREMATKYNLPLQPLEDALKLYNPKKEAKTHLLAAQFGFTGNRSEAEKLAKAHGFSLEELKDDK